MDSSQKEAVYTTCTNAPITQERRRSSEESPPILVAEEEITVTVDDDEDDLYGEEFEVPFFLGQASSKDAGNKPHIRRRNERFSRIRNNINSESIDVIDIGKAVILSTVDRSLKAAGIEKAVKTAQTDVAFIADVSMEALVSGLMAPDAFDARFAMVGSSVMWNVLKSNMRDVKNTIVIRSSQSHTEQRYDGIDLHAMNVPKWQSKYLIKAVGVFEDADLQYVFSLLTFRSTAKLLNKTKQFLKAYFIIACRPKCMIWRYSLRRSGASHKKAILHLPLNIVQIIINYLLDLTGIGQGNIPYVEMDQNTPFSQSLGEDEAVREMRYHESCQLKDSLSVFFRDAIIDVLNEVREMPFCLASGTLVSPCRGRPLGRNCVTWKQYETVLKKEHDFPTPENTEKRIAFELALRKAASQKS